MSTRGRLALDVIAWAKRDDVGSGDVFNSLLRVAEAQIRRRVRTREQEVTTTLTASGREADLPTGFLRLRSLTLDSSQSRVMDYLPPARLRESPYWDNTGSFSNPTPQAYTIEGERLVLAPAPSEANPTDLFLTYVAAFAPLNDVDDTNWILQEAFDVYLWGVLAAVAIYLEDEELEVKYDERFDRSVRELLRSENRARTPSAAGLRVIGSPHEVV